VVAREREVVLGLQPAVIGAAELCEGFQFDHCLLPLFEDFSTCRAQVPRPAFGLRDQAPKPPSTLSTVPVTNDASGLARNTTPAAISSAVPKRCSACCWPWGSARSPPSFGFMSVSIEPGCSTFTVMPRGPRSRAAPLV